MMRSSLSDSLTRFACIVLSYALLVTLLSPPTLSVVRASSVVPADKASAETRGNAARTNGALPSLPA